MFSSFASLLMFLVDTNPALSSSNNEKTFFTVFFVTLTPALAVMMSTNDEKSMLLTAELLKSLMIWKRVGLVCSYPCAENAALSSSSYGKNTFCVDDSSSIDIEQVKCLFELWNFIAWNSWPLVVLGFEGTGFSFGCGCVFSHLRVLRYY